MKYLIKIVLILIIASTVFSCTKKDTNFYLEIYPFLNFPIFDKNYDVHTYEERDSIKYEKNKFKVGDTIYRDLRDGRGSIDWIKYPDIINEGRYMFENIQAYKNNDSIFLLFITTYGSLEIYIHKTQVSGYDIVAGGKIEQYGAGKHKSSTLKIPFSRCKLFFKDRSLNIGDTIRGYLYIETQEYYELGEKFLNIYKGPFTTIITNRDEYEKYRLPKIYI